MRIEDSPLKSTALFAFLDEWANYDPNASHVISTNQLKRLLFDIGEPLGLRKGASRAAVMRKMVSLDIPDRGGVVHFIETLIPLARRALNVVYPLSRSYFLCFLLPRLSVIVIFSHSSTSVHSSLSCPLVLIVIGVLLVC